MLYINQLADVVGKEVTLKGWVYNIRSSKKLLFVLLRDGTGLCQSIISQEDVSEELWEQASGLQQECAVEITGIVNADERSVGGHELHVTGLKVISVTENYPITPKEHGIEFLMEHRHLWLRSRKQWAAMRVRNTIIYSIHRFFQEKGFIQMDAPVFTGNAAEGTTNLFETDYFDRKAYLTQSGQLYGEAMAMAHGKIYTFGPTFRAEKSKTRRHLTEFWMIEPEMAFYDLAMNMDLAEEMIRHIITDVLEQNKPELEILERDIERLEKVKAPFPRISYTEAVERLASEDMQKKLDAMMQERHDEKVLLQKEKEELDSEFGQAKKGRKFQIDRRRGQINARMEQIDEDLRNIPVWKKSAQEKKWGDDFGGSDETLLTMEEETPVMVYGYPAEIKAFYMKRDPENDKVALGVDMLAPEGYGEIIGGGQREEDLDTLMQRLKEHDLPEEPFRWYLDLRRYGSVPHSGFGLGLERTVAWICGLKHVRETIPFPRMMGRIYP
ncbi:asparagine--tRNA ligase [Balneolaceae bacterium ANBcel3]|nr:asparagine--tRNA ligase [Balneolaceae bacterium ANBcel3]